MKKINNILVYKKYNTKRTPASCTKLTARNYVSGCCMVADMSNHSDDSLSLSRGLAESNFGAMEDSCSVSEPWPG